MLLAAWTMGLTFQYAAFAADSRFVDWPCMQIKVPEISVAAVWSGPPIDDVASAWQEDTATRDLIGRVAARRTPLDAAQTALSDFLAGAPEERLRKAKLVFAGVFATLNQERSQVMSGIERLFRRQRAFAGDIRSEIAALRSLQDAPDHDQRKVDDLTNRIEWDIRIFEERRKTINYACEVPILIEQRLFALARMIQELM